MKRLIYILFLVLLALPAKGVSPIWRVTSPSWQMLRTRSASPSWGTRPAGGRQARCPGW